MTEKETIERAAIQKDGVVYAVPRPGRHDAAIRSAAETLGREGVRNHEQGFVTSTGRFVGRYQAARIAFAAGQIKKRISMLTSEDVW